MRRGSAPEVIAGCYRPNCGRSVSSRERGADGAHNNLGGLVTLLEGVSGCTRATRLTAPLITALHALQVHFKAPCAHVMRVDSSMRP